MFRLRCKPSECLKPWRRPLRPDCPEFRHFGRFGRFGLAFCLASEPGAVQHHRIWWCQDAGRPASPVLSFDVLRGCSLACSYVARRFDPATRPDLEHEVWNLASGRLCPMKRSRWRTPSQSSLPLHRQGLRVRAWSNLLAFGQSRDIARCRAVIINAAAIPQFVRLLAGRADCHGIIMHQVNQMRSDTQGNSQGSVLFGQTLTGGSVAAGQIQCAFG